MASETPSIYPSLLLLLPQFSPVAQSCPTLWPHGGQHARLPSHHQLLELTQTHVHRVGDAYSVLYPYTYLGVYSMTISLSLWLVPSFVGLKIALRECQVSRM